MEMIAAQPRSIFLGQAVKYLGTGMSKSFQNIPVDKLMELPVAENFQLGLSIGLALDGMIPVSIFPRFNFLVCAADQIVNHLDKLPLYSGYRPKVLIRVAVPTPEPLNPGEQHTGNFSQAFRLMLKTVRVVELESAADIVPAYRRALEREGSTILVEFAGRYGDPI